MKFVGAPLRRREDDRLLRGQGRYVTDLELPGVLHAVFVRSPVAHARIRSVASARARGTPGAVLVLDGAELERALPPVRDNQMPLPSKWKAAIAHRILNPRQPLLATDKVRHVGEAVAVVLGESRAAALDAAETVEVDYEHLDPVVDPEAALTPGSVLVHERLETNEIGWFAVKKGDPDAAFAGAPHTLRRRIVHHRYAAMPMECRAVAAEYDVRTDAYTIWSSTQVAHWVRSEVATTLAVPEGRVRVVAPDVGGGFGVKGHVYPEDMLMPFLARMSGRPVRWAEERREHALCSCHSRDQRHDAEIAFAGDGRILAVRDRFVVDCGAWNPLGVAVVYNTAAHLPGPYRVPHFSVVKGIPNLPRYGNRKFPTRFTLRPLPPGRGRPSTSPSAGTSCRGC